MKASTHTVKTRRYYQFLMSIRGTKPDHLKERIRWALFRAAADEDITLSEFGVITRMAFNRLNGVKPIH